MEVLSVDQQVIRSMALLKSGAVTRDIQPGQIIFEAGDLGECFYGVLEGKVELQWVEGGPPEILGPGRVFGGGALVKASHERHGTATAVEPTQVLEMNREAFLFALQTLPMFGLELLASLELRLEDLHRQFMRS